jgi:hypothetical protein
MREKWSVFCLQLLRLVFICLPCNSVEYDKLVHIYLYIQAAASSLISNNRYPSLPGGDSGDLIVIQSPPYLPPPPPARPPSFTNHLSSPALSPRRHHPALSVLHIPQVKSSPCPKFAYPKPSIPLLRLSNICYAGQHLQKSAVQNRRLEGQPRLCHQRHGCCHRNVSCPCTLPIFSSYSFRIDN